MAAPTWMRESPEAYRAQIREATDEAGVMSVLAEMAAKHPAYGVKIRRVPAWRRAHNRWLDWKLTRSIARHHESREVA